MSKTNGVFEHIFYTIEYANCMYIVHRRLKSRILMVSKHKHNIQHLYNVDNSLCFSNICVHVKYHIATFLYRKDTNFCFMFHLISITFVKTVLQSFEMKSFNINKNSFNRKVSKSSRTGDENSTIWYRISAQP